MEKLLNTLGWKELFPQTLERVEYVRDKFRECFTEEEISDEDLIKTVGYAFGMYGENFVFGIYIKLQEQLRNGLEFKEVMESFINVFKDTLDNKTLEVLKPKHYIDLMIELLYSFVIKGNDWMNIVPAPKEKEPMVLKNMAFLTNKEEFTTIVVGVAETFNKEQKAGHHKNIYMVVRGTVRGELKNEILFVEHLDGENLTECMERLKLN